MFVYESSIKLKVFLFVGRIYFCIFEAINGAINLLKDQSLEQHEIKSLAQEHNSDGFLRRLEPTNFKLIDLSWNHYSTFPPTLKEQS